MRDIEPGEQALLDQHGVRVLEPDALLDRVRGKRVFLHLDMDVTDIPGTAFPAPGGWSFAELERVLTGLAEAAAELVGAEVTAFSAPDRAAELATILEPLL